MQKLITVSVDTKKLLKNTQGAFAINEVDSVNDLLEQGWEIEEWDILVEDAGDGRLLLLVTLNDEAMFDEDEFDDDFEFEEDDDEEEDEDDEDDVPGFEEDDKVKRL